LGGGERDRDGGISSLPVTDPVLGIAMDAIQILVLSNTILCLSNINHPLTPVSSRIRQHHFFRYHAKRITMTPRRISRDVEVQVIMAEKSRMMIAMMVRASSFSTVSSFQVISP
jgi:hypothetical protein